MFAVGRWGGVTFLKASVRNLVFPVRLAMDADPRGILAIGDKNIGTRTLELLLLTFPIPEEQGWWDPQTDWRPEA